MTDEEFQEALRDISLFPNRVLLLELDYAIDFEISGHGRRNSRATLNEPLSLTVDTYNNTLGEVTFSQALPADNYSYEIWIGDTALPPITGGSHIFNANSGDVIDVAIASVKPDGRYSRPLVASVTMGSPSVQTVQGTRGNWAFVGNGPGIGGTGTLNVASQVYFDEENNKPYRDYMLNSPEMEDSLFNFQGVGDVELVNPDPYSEENWLTRRWRGYWCRWFFGFTHWPKSDFKQIASVLTSECSLAEEGVYKFSFVDSGQQFRRVFLTSDYVNEAPAKTIVSYIMQQVNLPDVTYINVPSPARNFTVSVNFNADTTIEQALRIIADSLGAYIRINQLGGIEMFIPDPENPVITLTEDRILKPEIRMVEETPAYKRVVVEMAANGPRFATTQALTGNLDETFTLSTLLTNTAEADTRLNELIDYYSVGHKVWGVSAVDVTSLIQVGDYVTIDSRIVSGTGLVREIKRSELSDTSYLELAI